MNVVKIGYHDSPIVDFSRLRCHLFLLEFVTVNYGIGFSEMHMMLTLESIKIKHLSLFLSLQAAYQVLERSSDLHAVYIS